MNALPLIETDDWLARFMLDEVVHGVTALAVKPVRLKVCDVDPPLELIATIAKLPLLGSLNAVTNTLVCGLTVAAMRTHPGLDESRPVPNRIEPFGRVVDLIRQAVVTGSWSVCRFGGQIPIHPCSSPLNG